jgi:hypothetical protein
MGEILLKEYDLPNLEVRVLSVCSQGGTFIRYMILGLAGFS